MDIHRRADQYYITAYERLTIRVLKELEQPAENSEEQTHERDEESMLGKHILDRFSPVFINKAILLAQNRDHWIHEQMAADERKDGLVKQHPIPNHVKCNTCRSAMLYKDHLFRNEGTELIFVFKCPLGHLPNKAIYPNEVECFFSKKRCDYCDHEISSKEEQKDRVLIYTDTCTGCGKVTTWDLDLDWKPEQDPPVTNEDREKYCTQFIGRKTFEQDLKAITNFIELNKETIHPIHYGKKET
jgi:hypothetical protein